MLDPRLDDPEWHAEMFEEVRHDRAEDPHNSKRFATPLFNVLQTSDWYDNTWSVIHKTKGAGVEMDDWQDQLDQFDQSDREDRLTGDLVRYIEERRNAARDQWHREVIESHAHRERRIEELENNDRVALFRKFNSLKRRREYLNDRRDYREPPVEMDDVDEAYEDAQRQHVWAKWDGPGGEDDQEFSLDDLREDHF